jgi:DNA (cytosine-5)-methyltransferase 1
MRGATLCSGIGAPECAAPDIDWIWSSDIEAFPNAVRAVRYPDSINLGDMTAEDFVERAAAVGLPDVLVAGTPCQAFSIAGLRQSLLDDRGNLTLLFIRICDAIDDLRRAAGLDPLWIVWENVPGVLSVSDNAFGALLAGLGGHDAPIPPAGGRRWPNAGVVTGPRRGVAWRTLDAQHFGLAQRRRRVFLLARGGAGNLDGADALLPIIDSLQRHPAPSRKTGQEVAGTLSSRASGGGGGPGAGTDEACAGYLQAIAPTLDASMHRKYGSNQWVDNGFAVMSSGQANAGMYTDGTTPSLTCLHEAPIVTHALTTRCSTVSEDGTGRGSPLVATPLHDPSPTLDASYHKGAGERNGIERQIVTVAFTQNTRDEVRLINGDGQIAGALAAQPGMKQTTYVSETARSLTARHDGSPCDDRGPNIVATPIAFQSSQSGVRAGELHATLDSNNGSRRHNGVISQSTVRRLTPRECERLQGFPDDWTLIELPLKSRQTRVRWAADAPRYKALGNSMAVPVMKYILDRIKLVNERT